MSSLALQRFFIEVGMDGKPFFAGLKNLNKKLNGLKKPMFGLNKAFSSMFKVAGVAGLTAMTLNAAKLGREMGLISRYTGISSDNISRMENAFAATGGDAKEVRNTLQRITQGLARLSYGDATFSSALTRIGISAWENGNVKDAEQIRLEMADFIRDELNAGSSLAQVSTFMGDLFNMSQAEVEELSIGSKKLLKRQQDIIKRTGYLRKEESKSLEDLEKKIKELKATTSTTYDRFLANAAPLFEQALDWLQKLMVSAQDHLESFKKVVKYVEDHTDFFAPILKGLMALKAALIALPALFTAISAHPLVALAIAGMTAGYAAGGGFSPFSFNEQHGINAIKLYNQGIIEYSELDKHLNPEFFTKTEKGWYSKGGEGGFVLAEPKYKGPSLPVYVDEGPIEEENIPEKPKLPVFAAEEIKTKNIESLWDLPLPKLLVTDEAGNPIDMSKVSEIDNSREINIHLENQNTINSTGEIDHTAALNAMQQNTENMVDYLSQRLANGGGE